MATTNDNLQTVRLATADKLTILGIVATVMLAVGGGAWAFLLSHDRDITMLKTSTLAGAEANQRSLDALRMEVREARSDIKDLLQQVSRLDARIGRQAAVAEPAAGKEQLWLLGTQ